VQLNSPQTAPQPAKSPNIDILINQYINYEQKTKNIVNHRSVSNPRISGTALLRLTAQKSVFG
jgi:hypothetical protein